MIYWKVPLKVYPSEHLTIIQIVRRITVEKIVFMIGNSFLKTTGIH